MEASLIVITHNQLQYLRESIASIEAQELSSKFETIIVNDWSNDGTREFLESLPKRESWRFIHCDRNVGRAAARNRGTTESSGRILIFIDGDLKLSRDFIGQHINFHRSKLGIAVGKTECPSNFGLNGYLQSRGAAKIGSASSLPFRYFTSQNFSIPKFLFDELNGFDTDYSTYGGEDLDLGCRIYKNGIDIQYLPSALAIHIEESSLSDVIRKRYQFGFHGLPLFTQKHPDVAQDIPVYKLYSSKFYRYLLIFPFNPISVKIIRGIVSRFRKPPFMLYDYLVIRAIFDGLNDARERKKKPPSDGNAPRGWVILVVMVWMIMINLLHLYKFVGDRYRTALKVIEDIIH